MAGLCWRMLLLVVCLFCADGKGGELLLVHPSRLQVGFDAGLPGLYLPFELARDWPGLQWQSMKGRARLIPDPVRPYAMAQQVLQMRYPAGKIGPQESGGQFLVSLLPQREYYLEYRVFFQPGFDFTRGGKLPGLTGGGSKYTGGRPTDDGKGWSARYMWRAGGKAVVYFYHFGQNGKYGDDLPLGVTFIPGNWYTLTQHVVVNTPGSRDGRLEVWVDRRPVLTCKDLVLRGPQAGDAGLVDSFYFSTFHGGSTPEFAPSRDCYACFDDFRISCLPFPEFLSGR